MIESLVLTRRITRRENEDVFILVVILIACYEKFRDREGILGWLPSSASVSVVVAANAAALERRESSDAVTVLPLYVSVRLFIVVDDSRGGLVRLTRPGCQLEEQLTISTGRNARRGEGSFSQGWLEGYNYRWSRVVD